MPLPTRIGRLRPPVLCFVVSREALKGADIEEAVSQAVAGGVTMVQLREPGAGAAERVPMNAAVWRFDPRTGKFEVVAAGTSNPWGLDFDADGATGFFHHIQRFRIRHPQATNKLGLVAGFLQPSLDLRPGAVYQHQANTETFEQIQVVHQRDELAALHHLAPERDDKDLAAKCVDIGRR